MELQIEKMVYGGDGLARLAADERGPGKTVFLPFVIAGERVDATLIQNRSGFARARLNTVLAASSERVEPGCPHFGRCGGCQYQHINYPAQLVFKAEILRETLRRTAKLELDRDIQPHSSQPWHYRNRTRMRVQHAPKFAVGYFRANSHDLLPVERCPISSALINRAIAAVWELGRAERIPPLVHGFQFFANHEDSELFVEVYVRPQTSSRETGKVAEVLNASIPQTKGVAVFTTSAIEDESRQFAPLTSTHNFSPLTSIHNEEATVVGQGHLTYQAARHEYRVSAGSFFQTNRFLVDELVEVATAQISGRSALDLYAGVGLFTVHLAAKFEKVVAVEGSPHAVADLRHNAPSNVTAIHASTDAFLETQAAQYQADFVLLDPPRAGLGERVTAALCRTAAQVVTLVSCDPATLSRDLRTLLESGFRVEQAHLFDLFPQTAHMETVLRLVR